MQSSGGLTDAHRFQGKDAILSGPAGGIVGAVEVSRLAGFDRIIGFDMGGTSTDVTHYAGEYERAFVTEVAGVRLARADDAHPHGRRRRRLDLHVRRRALPRRPESAGANPGPASYRRGGPLTVTDCNVMVGKLDPALFPQRVRPERRPAARRGRSCARSSRRSPREVAAQDRPRAHAGGSRRRLPARSRSRTWRTRSSTSRCERGYDVTEYTLCCFGGAGGQHACLVADALGMTRVFIHPLAGVLSAYGMGLADVRALRQQAVEARAVGRRRWRRRERDVRRARARGARPTSRRRASPPTRIGVKRTLHLKYDGTDTTLEIARRARARRDRRRIRAQATGSSTAS